MRAKRSGGSITVFAALSLMLVAQMLFALLEAARNVEYYKLLQMNSDTVLESVFADYVSPLWEQYRLLGFSAQSSGGAFSCNRREAEMRSLSAASLGSSGREGRSKGRSLFAADMTDAQMTSYLLMTDQQGKVFQETVASYMKHNLAYEAAQALYSSYESAESLKREYGDGDASIGEALDALESAKETRRSTKSAARTDSGSPAAATDSGTQEDNLLTTVTEAKKAGVLSLVLPKGAHISAARMDLKSAVSGRTLEQGIGGRVISGDWYDQVLLNRYLIHYLANYTDGSTDRGLNYELEYLIGGKGTDEENLKVAVSEILAIREAMNLASLAASPRKVEEALLLASVLAGATANPLIVEAVKYGIMAAWAFAESVLDLRTLLSGGHIVPVKSEADWSSDLNEIPALLSGSSQAKNCPQGKSYREYLSLLLYFHSAGTLSMRALDVQEAAIQKAAGYENFRMDCVVCEAEMRGIYSYRPVFSGFVTLAKARADCFCIETNSRYSYLESPMQL